jgi:hypothetical protein
VVAVLVIAVLALLIGIVLMLVLRRIPGAGLGRRRTTTFFGIVLAQGASGSIQVVTGLPDAPGGHPSFGRRLGLVGTVWVLLKVNPRRSAT